MDPKEHGFAGSDPTNFVRVLPKRDDQLSLGELAELSADMMSTPDAPSANPDAEENMAVPAGYTYFGQFIDHDLTRIPGNTPFAAGTTIPPSARTPLLDLDCLYGNGPDGRNPALFENGGARLIEGEAIGGANGRRDLPRNGSVALIGDSRNDENSIVCNLQTAFISFHNAVVDRLAARGLNGSALWEAASNEVRWTYQRIVVEDYLPRIINAEVVQAFDAARQPDARGKSSNQSAFKLYPDAHGIRSELPLEFATAAYRFGHSMVRTGYILQNGQQPGIPIFAKGENSLVGFGKLSALHVINDWRRFFPDSSIEEKDAFSPAPGQAAGDADGANTSAPDTDDAPRLQFAYRIDTNLVNPLFDLPDAVANRGQDDAGNDIPSLPSLALRNLLRARAFSLASGQDAAKALGKSRLDSDCLVIRTQISKPDEKTKQYQFQVPDFTDGPEPFLSSTPLWFYMLAEAQVALYKHFGKKPFSEDAMLTVAQRTASQLGDVGGTILLEVFNGILDSDPNSYRNHLGSVGWTPMLAKMRVYDLVKLNLTP